MAMVVGAVIGSGIFAKPAANATASDSVSLIMIGWIAGGVITLISAVCMAELSLMMPKAGGTYVYIRQAYGRLPAFLSGWNETIFFQSTACAALAVYFTMTLGTTIGVEFSSLEIVFIVITIAFKEIEIIIKTIPKDIAIDKFPLDVSKAIVVVITLV